MCGLVLLASSLGLGFIPGIAGDDPAAAGRAPIGSSLGVITAGTKIAPKPARYGFAARPSYRPNDPLRPTVVLVHGINSTSESFVHLAPALEAEGVGVVTYDYPYDRDLDESAGAFADEWKRFRRERGDERPWTILTHSMGALIARSYVEGNSFGRDVDRLILIGPTNAGAAVARGQTVLQIVRGVRAAGGDRDKAIEAFADGLGAAAVDLTPGSAFLRDLNARGRRAGVSYHILAGRSGFLSKADRRKVEAQLSVAARAGGLLGGITRIAVTSAREMLDEMADGTGDGCVSVESTKLDGVTDHCVIGANHVELIRGPLLYPDPGPIACMPFLRERLKGGK